MVTLTPQRLVSELVEQVWNGRDLDRLTEMFTDPFTHNDRAGTLAELAAWTEREATVWADVRYQVVQCVSDAEHAAFRWQAYGRHVGRWGPAEATGRTIAWEGAHFLTITAGRISAMWALADVFGKARQLGVVG